MIRKSFAYSRKKNPTYPYPVAKFESQMLLRPIIRDGTRGNLFSSEDHIAVIDAYTLPFRLYHFVNTIKHASIYSFLS